MRGPSGLSKTQRERVAVVISAEAHCPYCQVAHEVALRLRIKDAALVDRLAVNYRHVDLSGPDRAMLDFAVKLTHTAHAATPVTSKRSAPLGSPKKTSFTRSKSSPCSTTTYGWPSRPDCSRAPSITTSAAPRLRCGDNPH